MDSPHLFMALLRNRNPTWQASSDSPSRGGGQVRMMAFKSSPMPTAETKASSTLKEHSWLDSIWLVYMDNQSANIWLVYG